MYGARMFVQESAAFRVLPQVIWPARDYVIAIITYLIVIPALLFWLEIGLGKLRRFLQVTLCVATAIGIAGVVVALPTRSPYRFISYNNILAISFLFVLMVVNAVPVLSKRYLVIPSRVAAVGTLVLAIVAL